MTPAEQRTSYILERLGPLGLTKSSAITLASLEGIVELIDAKSLPPNPRPRPHTVTVVNGKVNPKDIRGDYRITAAQYLGFWLEQIKPKIDHFDRTLTWPAYQALRDYCESKVQQPSAVA